MAHPVSLVFREDSQVADSLEVLHSHFRHLAVLARVVGSQLVTQIVFSSKFNHQQTLF